MSTKNVLKKGLVLSRTNFVTFHSMENSTEAIWKVFGKWFQLEREAVGRTQEDVARYTGLNVKTVSRIENGEPTKRMTVISLAEAIGMNPEKALSKTIFSSPKPENETHEILDSIQIIFQDGKKVSKKQQEEILNAARYIARGVLAEKELNE